MLSDGKGKIMPDEGLKNLVTLLAGAIALYASITYMLQSRHHGIDEHERRLQSDFTDIRSQNLERWREIKSSMDLQSDEAYRYALNILDQLLIVRSRYKGALVAFILVMTQLLLLVLSVCYLAWPLFDKLWADQRITLIVGLIVFAPGVFALIANIGFDLIPAFRIQRKSREWLDYMTVVENGQLRPRLGFL
jgi:hypothetical protein